MAGGYPIMKTVTVTAAKRFGITFCRPETTMRDVAAKMTEEDISCLVVEDEEGYLAGIISRTDVLRAALARDDWRRTTCAEWMTRDVVTVPPDALLHEAAELMQRHNIHRVVVAEPAGERLRPLAVISSGDIVYHLHQRGLQLLTSEEES
jgi:CBS domain-containing protein